MATKFLSLGSGEDEDLQMFTERVQQAMTTIESKGGKYVDSHWLVASPAGPGGRDKGRIEAPGVQDPVPVSAGSS